MHVERDPPARTSVDRDVEALDGGMPALFVHDRCELHAEERGVEIEDRLPHTTVLEVRPHLLRVEPKALRLHAIGVVEPLPGADRRRAGMVDPFLREELRELRARG